MAEARKCAAIEGAGLRMTCYDAVFKGDGKAILPEAVAPSLEPAAEVVDLRTEYKINKTFTVYGEVTNLFDETYASSTLIVDQARPDQAAFLPGDGRGFYAGMKARF